MKKYFNLIALFFATRAMAVSTHTMYGDLKLNLETASRALYLDVNGKVRSSSTVTDTELGYLDGVTSALQTQIDGKQATITGAATSITSSNLTASRAVQSDASGKVEASSVTSTEMGYLSGVSSAIQTQLNGKESTITATTSADYYRGDKTFQALNKAAVGLSNVDNTSDASKPVSTATQTALDAKVAGAASSVDSEVMLFSGTGGKTAKRATGSGFAKLSSGVLSTSSTVNLASEVTGTLPVANGGTGTTDYKPIYKVYVAGAAETNVCNGNPCTIYRDANSLVSGNVSRSGTGTYSFTSTGLFSASAFVSCWVNAPGGASMAITSAYKANASGVITGSIVTRDNAGGASDSRFVINCQEM
jgi:hypothetical protein